MARDYTKYTVEGLAENLNKRQLVFAIVKDWASKNKSSFEELQKVFPDTIQGSKGLIMKESEVKDPKRFNMKEPLSIKNGLHVVVSNQWGDNVTDFIKCAEKLGYIISKSSVPKTNKPEKKLLKFKNFSISGVSLFFKTLEENQKEDIDLEIESLLEESPKYSIVAKIFERSSEWAYAYDTEGIGQFEFDDDPSDLLNNLRDMSLLSRMIQEENLSQTLISNENLDFVLLFSCYFIVALETLINLDDKEMIAEFILNQSISTIEDDYNVNDDEGDWISDLVTDLIEHIYGYDIFDYEGECEIEANYFHRNLTMGYDYHAYSQNIIDSLI